MRALHALMKFPSKLDDVIVSNLYSSKPQSGKRPLKKMEVPDYGIDIEDEVEDMGLDDLFGDYVPPQQEKQLVPKPPTYEESLADILEGNKEIYVDPQYLSKAPDEFYKLYDDENFDDSFLYEGDDHGKYDVDDDFYEDDDHDLILDDVNIPNYTNVESLINQPEMTGKRNINYLGKITRDAEKRRKQLVGLKSKATKDYNKGEISKDEKDKLHYRIDKARTVLGDFINFYNNKLDEMQKGSGIRGRRRKQRGGNVMFFNDPKQLLKKLELIVGEIIAGNTSINMRNMGVNILDTLLRMSTINRPQYTKLYNQYFKA